MRSNRAICRNCSRNETNFRTIYYKALIWKRKQNKSSFFFNIEKKERKGIVNHPINKFWQIILFWILGQPVLDPRLVAILLMDAKQKTSITFLERENTREEFRFLTRSKFFAFFWSTWRLILCIFFYHIIQLRIVKFAGSLSSYFPSVRRITSARDEENPCFVTKIDEMEINFFLKQPFKHGVSVNIQYE